jgi:transposase
MSEQLSTEQRIAAVKLYYETKNSAEVQRRWSRLSDSSPPTRRSILKVVQKFEATGSVLHAKGAGPPRTATTAEKQEELLASLKRSPQKSSHRLSAELGVSDRSIRRILEELKYHPFRPHLIHGLHEEDFDKRMEFSEIFLGMVENDESILDRVYWSDEAIFKLNGHINRYNCVYWSENNPHITIEREANEAGVMVWCAISSEGIIGPCFFDEHVTAKSYLKLLKERFWPQVRDRMEAEDVYFQHDGAPAHYAKEVREWLDENFGGCWLGRRGPIEWPPRSPDLTPPDFFLWGVLKDRVYANRPKTIPDLKREIESAIRGVPQDLCAKVCRSVPSRLQRCLKLEGAQTEPF